MTNPLGDLISRGEGGYNSYNRGTQHGHIVPANQNHDFAQMTLGELLRRQALPVTDADKVFAVGKYQIIPTTMREAVSKLRLDLNERYTPQTQERIFADFLIQGKRPPIHAYITGQPGASLHAAQKSAAQEWASIDDPDTPGRPYGAYGKHGNHSSIRAGHIAGALNKMRDAYQVDISRGMSPQDAWRKVTGQIGVTHENERTATPATQNRPEASTRHPQHPTHHTTVPRQELRPGDHTPRVHQLQQILSHLGYRGLDGRPLAVDGDFGSNTEHAVRAFQREHGLHVDGVAGKHTLAVIDAIQANPFTSKDHPHHALYEQSLQQVHAEESRRQIPHGPHSEALAGALAVAATRHGMTRIDRVELNDTGSLVRAVQVSPLRDEPGLNRSTDPVSTRQAMHMPLLQSSEQILQAATSQQPHQDVPRHVPAQPVASVGM